MNAALAAYLSELVDAAKVNTGYAYALQKCAGIVRRARSPLNPAKIELLSNFGDGQVSQRVRGHFSKEEQRSLLWQMPPPDQSPPFNLGGRVKDVIAEVLTQGQFGGKALSRALRTRFEKTSEGLGAFLSLEDVQDVKLLRSCCPELLDHLMLLFPRARKQRVGPSARRAAVKRKRSQVSVEADTAESFVEAVLPEVAPDKAPRPCRALSGGWAIMVGLHLAGCPQTKKQLVALSSVHGLCREPLVKQQRTVSREGQWYDAWSSHMRLCKVGWLLRKGSSYALTDAGRSEAARYAQERQESEQGHTESVAETVNTPPSLKRKSIFQSVASADNSSCKNAPTDRNASGQSLKRRSIFHSVASAQNSPCISAPADRNASECRAKTFSLRAFPSSLSARARCDAIDLSDSEDDDAPLAGLASSLKLKSSPSSSSTDTAFIASEAAFEGQLGRSSSSPSASISSSTPAAFTVLVDSNEKPHVRESLSQMLPSSVQIRLPGVDYAFGKLVDGEWVLANVLVERKTVHDYLSTLNSERGEFQAGMHAGLKDAGFSVLVILEGINDLRSHPQHEEILHAAHSSPVPVLTTASINDTAELLLALAAHANAHDGWTLTALQVMLQHHYEVDPVSVCETVLVALGVAREFAHSVASTCGSLDALLAELPPGVKDEAVADACLEKLAMQTGLTLFQTGKVLHSLGIKNVQLSRKRGPSKCLSLPSARVRQPWPTGVLVKPRAHVRVGLKIPKAMKRHLQAFADVREVDSLDPDVVQICICGFPDAYNFRIGAGTCLDPGAHWLLLPKALDWKAVTARRAQAFVSHSVISSLCASGEQVVQHIAARFKAIDSSGAPTDGEGLSKRVLGSGCGLAAVFRLAQTAGGSLPLKVARELAEHETVSALGLAQLAWRLKSDGPNFLLALGVRELGVERADSVRALLLGGA